MRDYLNSHETNQYMVLASVLQLMEGKRNTGVNGPKISTMLEEWKARDNLTKDEHRSLKTADTYLKKFVESVFDRLSPREQKAIMKRLKKFDFRLVDDFTLQKIKRDVSDRMVNAVVPREQFNDWCEQIMALQCKSCTKDCNTCPLYEVFDDNFVPESSFNLPNCKYAYILEEGSSG
ncbi:DUF5651 domain-containing protein [Bacillus spizizenii]|nr:DUF5651 domain-containing protein [Bacillus spizizenii]